MKKVTIEERFGTATLGQAGAVQVDERIKGVVRAVAAPIEVPRRPLEEAVRFVGAEYEPFVAPLEISGFYFFQIGRTAATVGYSTNRNARCWIYTRKETPLGSWAAAVYATYHATHLHLSGTLEQGTWYHLYVRALDAGGIEAFSPAQPSYYRFKTATRSAGGIYDGIYN